MLQLDQFPAVFQWPILFCATTTAVTYILSILTSNVSQVDRLWTFLPTIYIAYYALLPLWPNNWTFPLVPFAPKELGWVACKDYSPRALLMLTLAVVWMFRLSYNTYRRGLFNLKDEDYRWAILRSQLPAWLFQVVNLTFISGIQNVILLLLGLPAYVAAVLQPHTALSTSDYLLAFAALIVLAIEFTADNQQYSFQGYKRAYLLGKTEQKGSIRAYDANDQWVGSRLAWVPSDAERGFVTKGLWAYSRHPNFLCEQTFWWIMTLIPVLAPPPPGLPPMPDLDLTQHDWPRLVFSILYPLRYLSPAIVLTTLFFASTKYTEGITSRKYPLAYRAYQERVAMFGPIGTLEKAIILTVRGKRSGVEGVIWGEDVMKAKVQ